ncbi:MAG: DegV family protein [Desulfitobacteriia bacterium]|jgi:DegV family protein with EDD domain
MARKIKIITDSTNDLSPDILQKYEIDVVPLYVCFAENHYKDGVELKPKDLFKNVENLGTLPKTAAPPPFDFTDYYTPYIQQGYDIIVITISKEMSSTYQNAVTAASQFPEGRIFVIDSQNLSSGIGSLVLVAAEMAAAGNEIEEIVSKIQELVPKVKVNFIIDTMEYLYKGGRCNALQNLIATTLRLRPTIGVKDGKMFVADKVRGSKERALNRLMENLIKEGSNIDYQRVFITHSLGSEEEADYLKKNLQNKLPEIEFIITNAGCVISSHCGKKTIGLIYISKQ